MLLRDKDTEELHAIFSQIDQKFEVWAHGSRVTGKAHEGSDLDLVLRCHDLQKFPIDAFIELKEKIQNSTIPILVELFDWARLPESFQKNIVARHEVFYTNLSSMVNEPKSEYNTSNVRKTESKT